MKNESISLPPSTNKAHISSTILRPDPPYVAHWDSLLDSVNDTVKPFAGVDNLVVSALECFREGRESVYAPRPKLNWLVAWRDDKAADPKPGDAMGSSVLTIRWSRGPPDKPDS